MAKQRETYTATKGVENEGYDFEVGMLSFYCFHLCHNDSIKDFKIAIYDDQHHPFDDIVIEIETDITEKYAIQLKHVKDKLILNCNHFGKNGKMVLGKYFKYDFSKSDHVVLLTNGVVNEEMTAGNCHMKLKMSLTPMEQCLDTCCNKENHIYEISNEDALGKITFYTSQKNRHEIDEALKKNFEEKFSLKDVDGVVQKFKNFFQQWKKGNFGTCKLDKQDIRMKIAEILFFNYIIEYRPQFEVTLDKKRTILQKLLNEFNITILQEIDERSINDLCGFSTEKKKVIEDGLNLLILAEDNGCKEAAVALWRLKKFPLIISVNEENKRMVQALLHSLQNENLSFILVGDVSKKDFQTERIFENLTDLDEKNYEALAEEFTFSVQGQKEISLKKLMQCNPRFGEIITMRELLQISTGSLLVGEVEDPLPQPYIPRRLMTTLMKTSSIEHFPNDLFAISGNAKTLRKKLPKCRFLTFEEFEENISLGNSLTQKSVVLCDGTSKSFATCLKYKKSNVHCLKLVDCEHLQLIYSKEKNENMRQFQTLSEDRLYEILKNNINLVCGGPGMGKLTLLRYLKKNCPPGYWTVKVDLQENEQLQNDSSFASKVRDCFKEVRRMIFFFCGIDNLQNNNLITATEYIKQLAEDDFKVWVFSEDHLTETLEKLFEVSSTHIEEFTEEEQQKYIKERLKSQMDQGLEKVLMSFKMLKNNDILGAPMHLYMLTEICIQNPKASVDEVFVLTDIYRYFIKTKYEHYLNKVSAEHHNQIIEDGIYYRTEQYKLAAISCLDPIHFRNVYCDRNFLNQINRIGDVVGIIFKISPEGSIIFSQQTYADYFAALWLVTNYRKVEDMKTFTFKEEFKNIFFMFNLEICKNHPAHIAILYQNYKQLQHHKNKLNEQDTLQRSVLHLACSYGTKLLKVQNTPEEKFKFGNKEAIKQDTESQRILDFLMASDFDPFQADNLFGWNLLDYAFNILNIYAIEKILTIHPETSLAVLNKLRSLEEDLGTIIYYSVKFGYENLLRTVSMIPSSSAAFNIVNCKEECLLYSAVQSGKSEIVALLLDAGTDISTITSTSNKRTALHQAAESDNKDIVELLLKRGAPADTMDRYRSTPLHLASIKGSFHSAELLLDYNADVNFSDNFGRTSLQLAATYGQIKILKLLLTHGARIDNCDKFGNSALSCARSEEIVKILSERGAPTVKSCRRMSSTEFDEYTSHQLHWIAFTGQTERIIPLLQDGWDINEVDHLGRTPLYRAVTEKHFKVAKIFIERGADVNAPDENQIGPLCKAIRNGDFELTKLILEFANVDVRDEFNYTPLHWAAMVGDTQIVKLLLSRNPDVDASDNFGRKPVDCAVEKGHYECVSIIEKKADLRLVAEERFRFLGYYESIFDTINTSRLTSFQEAVNSGNYSLVKKFLKQGKDINEIDTSGYTILCRAVVKKHKSIIELFLQKGADIRGNGKCKSSALHLAAFFGGLDILNLLIDYNADINSVDAFGYSPIEVAAIRGNDEVISVLLKKGANDDVVDNCGNSPLDWACKQGHEKSVEVLLKNDEGETRKNFVNMARNQHEFLKLANFV